MKPSMIVLMRLACRNGNHDWVMGQGIDTCFHCKKQRSNTRLSVKQAEGESIGRDVKQTKYSGAKTWTTLNESYDKNKKNIKKTRLCLDKSK